MLDNHSPVRGHLNCLQHCASGDVNILTYFVCTQVGVSLSKKKILEMDLVWKRV